MNYGACVDVTCLVCGASERIYEDQIEQKEYCCPCCGITMSKSQWRREKINFYIAEEFLRQVAAHIIAETVEVCAFDCVCRTPDGKPLTFSSNVRFCPTADNLRGIEDIRNEMAEGGE